MELERYVSPESLVATAVARITSGSDEYSVVDKGAYCERRQSNIWVDTIGSTWMKVTFGRPLPVWSIVLLKGLITAPTKTASCRSSRHASGKPFRVGTICRNRRAPGILKRNSMRSSCSASKRRLFWSWRYPPQGLAYAELMFGK